MYDGDALVLSILLLLASATDLRRRTIPNVLIAIGVGIFVPLHFGETGLIAHRVTAGVLCSVCALAVAVTYDMFRGTPGMGMGDVKLLFVVGLYAGVCGLWVFFLGAVSGAAFGIGAMVLGYLRPQSRLPFAPFLCLGWCLTNLLLIRGPIPDCM